MQILPLNFSIYSIAGIWRPHGWSSNVAKLLYNVFTVCTLVPMYFLLLTQFLDIVLIVDNMDDFSTNSVIFITIIGVCCKATIAVLRRGAIIDLVQMLLTEPCKPRDKDEMAIQSKFDAFIRSCTIKYLFISTIALMGVALKSVLNVMQGLLPCRVWLPYDSKIPLMFWITAIQQILSMIFATIIDVSTETLLFGLILQTCAQLEIFERRLGKFIIRKTAETLRNGSREYFSSASLNKRGAVISEYIRHHLSIFKYAKTFNKIFSQVLFVQFFGSVLVLCTTVYYLSSHITESESATLVVYAICMFVQIYLYCWSGNEVTLKSVSVGDAIFKMEWLLLSINDKKNLIMIMKRCTIPIKFTSSFLITLSLQSFSSILKASYSAFNLLQE